MILNYILHLIDIGYTVSSSGELLKNGKKTRTKAKDCNGYLIIRTRLSGKNIAAAIHRIQAYQKYGARLFEDTMEVRHLDNNKLNNSYENIAIGTHSENMLDIPISIRLKHSREGAAQRRRLSYEEAEDIRNKHKAGYTYKSLCLEYKVSKSLISYIVNNKTYNDPEHINL
jgi:hypothetical protein